ncbi:hypothetical protein UVI_02001550 [Ustilaginoidea virens]|uniref:D-xylose 1-dehydrogenase (NADP(+), D-xylono-1,5-lactone-forming) n=1 Tax=Ustilaginoidea virens TaxID=1159556 RepID=A0A1B5KUP0_USTVR|nr:hypothetical protein UVI_02001550 [Ustilaginoidea virens]
MTDLGRAAFCKDLLTDPASRDVHDVGHQIVAVASSTSADRAAAFLRGIDGPASAKAYGSYAELVADADVDIVYVATPHSHHFQNAMLALRAGKNVLCEKALTVTASQARKLVDTAREKKLFLMEAVWTRFLPLSVKIRELVASGEIGTVYRTLADLSFNENSEQDDGTVRFPDSHRMVNKDLAGGALLDLGVYALTWVFQSLYHVRPAGSREAPVVLAAANQYRTGADANTSVICQFPRSRSLGVATTSLLVGTCPRGQGAAQAPAVRIQGSKGEIQVAHPAFRPPRFSVIRARGAGAGAGAGEGAGEGEGAAEVVECPVPRDAGRDWGHGMFWEADECARCVRDGRTESDTLPWSESIVMMETMEEALRQGGVEYPERITTDVYDEESPLNTGGRV